MTRYAHFKCSRGNEWLYRLTDKHYGVELLTIYGDNANPGDGQEISLRSIADFESSGKRTDYTDETLPDRLSALLAQVALS